MRVRRRLSRRHTYTSDWSPGALARFAVGAKISRLWRFCLRHLRWLFLSRQGCSGDRRRQYRRRGGTVSHQFCLQGDARASPRPSARRAHPARTALSESENLGALEYRPRRRARFRQSAQGDRRSAAQRQDRRNRRAGGRRNFHRHRSFAGDRACRRPGRDEAFGLRQARSAFDGDFGAGAVRRRRCHRRRLSAGGHGGRARLHGGARSRAISGGAWRGRAANAGRAGGGVNSAIGRGQAGNMQMDWDKLKVFHAAAEAGSFTHAGEQLGLSQSAVSRQVSALEQELAVSLFHRHARGLILTEQGELLFRTAHDVFMKLEAARAKLTDSRERPNGDLRVTTTPGIGVHWLTPRLGEFVELYPDVHLSLITTDEELDLAMREADVAIRLRQPTQPDLIQRKLFSVHFHVYASPEYLKKFGTPRALDDLDNHRVLLLGGSTVPNYLENRRWLIEVGRDGKGPRTPALTINSVLGILRACQRGIGVAMLPDYLVEENGGLVQLFGESDSMALDAYFVYPEELKTVARVQVFRDFLVAKAQRWHF